MASRFGAVAVDMGASSARFAAGWIENDRLGFEVVEQVQHGPVQPGQKTLWDTDVLFDVCDRAVKYAASTFEEATIGIDTWGVDHGFIGGEGNLVQALVAYRDDSHARAMATIESHQARLYELTGIQKQPFNTICQLIARREEDPQLPNTAEWFLLPDLLSMRLGGSRGYELTHASTTQLLGLDGTWCQEAFDIAGWPVPRLQPELPGQMIGRAASNVDIVRVGSHDTASAVCGLGDFEPDVAFLSIGTWSLFGCVLDTPLVTAGALASNFTNERAVDGRVRFLKNIPGLFVMNRLKDDLAIREPMSEWLKHADQSVPDRLDLFATELFHPLDMAGAVTEQLGYQPQSGEEWAGIALMSLADCIAEQLKVLEQVVGRTVSCIRAGGGGSASEVLCQAVADACGCPVVAGPTEATVVGNLGMQLLSKGLVRDLGELDALIRASIHLRTYHPRE